MDGLRERRHAATKRHLVDVAFSLFVQHGYDSVTMEQIARTAGVSRSTAYRRFPSKEDVVLDVARRWLDAFDAALDELTPDASLQQAVAAPVLAVARHIDDHHDLVRMAYAILERSPTLQQHGAATTAWLERLVVVVERFSDVDTETALTIAGAHLGAIDAMMLHWAATGGTASVTEATTRLLDRLAPMLPLAD